jgi:hypothetical protein
VLAGRDVLRGKNYPPMAADDEPYGTCFVCTLVPGTYELFGDGESNWVAWHDTVGTAEVDHPGYEPEVSRAIVQAAARKPPPPPAPKPRKRRAPTPPRPPTRGWVKAPRLRNDV